MGDHSHIIELIDQILEETADKPNLQEKIFDLRDALFQAQQSSQQYALKIKTLEETVSKLKSPAHRVGTVLGQGEGDLYRLVVGGTEYQAAVTPEILGKEALQAGDQVALNEGFVAIARLPRPSQGPVARITTRLADGQWLVTGQTGNSETLALCHPEIEAESLKVGDEIILDPNQRVILARLPKRKSGVVVEDDLEQVDWSNVGGQTKVIEEVRKVIEYPILHKEILNTMEYQLPKGFLFYGPPGCGKTLIGRAILSDIIQQLKQKESNQELEGRFIHVKGPEILNMWLGESERKVREIFKKARDYKKKSQVPFIFIDEAESILGTRQAMRGNNISNTLVPMFCAEMDGIQSLRDAVVILATNRPDLMDAALLRPGRFDKMIHVGPPDAQARREILAVHLRRVPLAHELALDDLLAVLVDRTPLYSGADLQSL